MMWWLLGCEEAALDTGELGFRVVGVSPEDGATDVVEAHVPELRFSSPADTAVCTTANIRIDAVHDDGTVAFPVAIELSPIDRGSKLQLTHAQSLHRPWRYALTVQSGADGCKDTEGNEIAAFHSTFEVP